MLHLGFEGHHGNIGFLRMGKICPIIFSQEKTSMQMILTCIYFIAFNFIPC